ncbi:MAG: alpha/beta fold hydrolase [Polaribacter sp.]|uniref:alpha/beta hydrolase family protein n=1 Tax=Polaribacter sp. TaxID=1920175 RepID=UPI003BB121C3
MHAFFDKEKLPSSLQIPKFVKIGFQFIYLISSRVTIIIAAKLFTTPIKFKTPNRELAMENSSQKKTLHIPTLKKDIHILSYGFSDKKVLFTHGWAGRSTQLFMIANRLLEKGFMVISFDAPSHGKSTGKTTNLKEYIEAIDFINQNLGPFDAAIGHSFGSMAIMNIQSQKPIFKSLVTVGSGDKVSNILLNFANNLGLNDKFGFKLIQFLEKKWMMKIDEYATHKAAENVKVPVLVIHDVLDGDVNVSCAINIRQSLKKGKLFITHGLGHTKILRDKNITNKIVDFIKENT